MSLDQINALVAELSALSGQLGEDEIDALLSIEQPEVSGLEFLTQLDTKVNELEAIAAEKLASARSLRQKLLSK